MLIGVVMLSFDAGDVPSPLCVMEGRNEERASFLWKCSDQIERPRESHGRGNMCSLQRRSTRPPTASIRSVGVPTACRMMHREPQQVVLLYVITQGNRGAYYGRATNHKHVLGGDASVRVSVWAGQQSDSFIRCWPAQSASYSGGPMCRQMKSAN